MKIITWNVNGIRSCGKKGLFDVFERENPDILCLQETKAHQDELEDTVVSPLGWQSYWSAAQRKGYSGTVIYTKKTPDEVRYGIGIPKYDAEGRFVIVRFDDLWIYSVYFPNGGASEERHLFKQEFLKKFLRHLRKHIKAGEKVILVGDYNVAYLEHDVYDPVKLSKESGFFPEEREWFREFLKTGFVDSFRKFHPDAKNRYSWWSYLDNSRMTNKGWRIDHICVSENLKNRLRSANIMEDQLGSDHCPVVAEVDVSL